MKIRTDILDRLLWPALLALLGVAGYALVTLPPVALDRWHELADKSPTFSRIYLGMVGAGALLLLFVWGWLLWAVIGRMRALRGKKRAPLPSELTSAQQEREMRKRLDAAARAAEQAEGGKGEEVRRQVEDLEHKIRMRRLEIAAFGAVSSGKSSLLNALLGEERFATDPRGGTTLGAQEVPLRMEGREEGTLILRDTPGLGEVLGQRRAEAAAEHARDADLVLLVLSGALRDFEFEALRALLALEKRVIVCLNKEDWYTQEDFDTVLRQLREQVRSVPRPLADEDVVAVRAKPSSLRRVRVLADGSEREDLVPVPPDISALQARLREVVQRDGRELLLANLLLRSRKVAAEAKAAAKGKA
jgi:uncharacterized protein